MKSKRKLIILEILVGLLITTLGLTYAFFTYSKTGDTNQLLVLGNIYMNYKENNQLVFDNAMPRKGINSISFYVVNPVMQDEESQTGVLGICEEFFLNFGLSYEDGTTSTTFCQGTGKTIDGKNMQEFINDYTSKNDFYEVIGDQLLDDEVLLYGNSIYYTDISINPDIQTDETGMGTLAVCEQYFSNYQFDDGTTPTTFCQGTGTYDGMSFQKFLNTFEAPLVSLYDKDIIQLKNNIPYFEFTISGLNEHTEDIWYDITLSYGDDHETRSTRIRDDLLKFRLVEVYKDENDNEYEIEYFTNTSYFDLSEQKIWVDKIYAYNEINCTYRLYMWISDETVIGNNDQDYTMEEWNDIFASVKVNVSGDFYEKTLDDSGVVIPVYATDIIREKVGTGGLVRLNREGTLYDENDELQTIGDYRYSGLDVDNYVYFNCQDNDGVYDYGEAEYDYNNNCEIWRMIGLLYDNYYENYYIKLVKNDVLTSDEIEDTYAIQLDTINYTIEDLETGNVYWSNTENTLNNNDWTTAGLQYYLNSYDDGETFSSLGYKTGLSSITQSLISYSDYYLGNVNSQATVGQIYQQERNNIECDISISENTDIAGCNIWAGNQPVLNEIVGLLSISDIAYSFDFNYWNLENVDSYYQNNEISVTSWMQNTMNHTETEWLISPPTTFSTSAFVWNGNGQLSTVNIQDTTAKIRPVISLFYDVIIKQGTGEITNPYVFGY